MICWGRTSRCGAAAVFPFCDLRIATGWPAPAPAACGPADWVPCAHAAALGACSCMPPTHASAHACASGGNAKTQPRVQTAGRSGGGVSQRRRGAQQRSAGRCRAGPLGVSRGSRRLKRNTRMPALAAAVLPRPAKMEAVTLRELQLTKHLPLLSLSSPQALGGGESHHARTPGGQQQRALAP